MPVNWDLVTKGNELPGIKQLLHTTYEDGELWVAGRGGRTSRLMIVGQNPGREELEQKEVFVGKSGQYLNGLLLSSGLKEFDPYITNAVKYGTLNNAQPKKADIKKCLQCLMHEIDDVQPDLIITLGATALEAVCGKKNNKWYKISDTRGEFVEPEWLGGIKVLAMWHPAYILRNPEHEPLMLNDMAKAVNYLRGGGIQSTVNIAPFDVLESTEAVADWIIETAKANGGKLQLSLDSEWHGTHHEAEGAYLRTMQMSTMSGSRTAVVRFFPPNSLENPIDPTKRYPNCADTRDVMSILRMFLENTKGSTVFGQNIIADGVWFMKYGLDIRPYTVYDTMLAEHLIDNRGPFNLTDLTLKYAPNMGRYDRYLKEWLSNHPEVTVNDGHGYGYIPEEILFPYGAGDVQGPWHIMHKQIPQLQEQGHFNQLGHKAQYPCLFETVMNLSRHLYELKRTGIQVDRQRLDELTKLFNDRVTAMRIKLGQLAAQRGFSDFNPNSTPQKQALLFGVPEADGLGGLGLPPLKSTGKRSKAWEWVVKQPPAVRAKYNPSTDGETLETLQERHPIVKALLNYNRINTVCKSFLREDETGGINGNIWPDGRIHSDFSQLTNTGRLRTSKPNCQNFPKASEGYIRDIFADKRQELVEAGQLGEKEEYPPSIRTVFVPPPGHIIIECDYSQAELFVTAGISQDAVMMDLLTTPGKDMHDKTTIESFKPVVYMPDGSPYNEEYMLALAARSEDEFKAEQKKLIYVDQKGKRMSREEFKDTMRVSGKSINFGILYGRGAHAIATQINAETGLGVTAEEIQIGIDGWHRTYSNASAFFSSMHKQALEVGYVANIWGRRRWFGKAENRAQEGAIQREAANHPIQGTVGDTMSLAIDRVANEKLLRGLRFKIINQVHDALLFEVPEDEIDKSVEVIRWGMGDIELPMPGGPMKLGVDIDFYIRWGEKMKKKAA
jgi:uracil-DNA glycosylase family 4